MCGLELLGNPKIPITQKVEITKRLKGLGNECEAELNSDDEDIGRNDSEDECVDSEFINSDTEDVEPNDSEDECDDSEDEEECDDEEYSYGE